MNTKSKPQHPPELQVEAVKLALEMGNTSKAAKDLGIPMQTLSGWVKKSKNGTLKGTASFNPEIAAILEENKKLKQALRIAEMEREILKKATAYFARDTK
jgi:transposase